VIPVILGLVILIDSILRIQLSVELKRLHQEKWVAEPYLGPANCCIRHAITL